MIAAGVKAMGQFQVGSYTLDMLSLIIGGVIGLHVGVIGAMVIESMFSGRRIRKHNRYEAARRHAGL